MIEEFAIVALTLDLPDYGLKAGDTGTVVDVVQHGKTVAVAEVLHDQIRCIEQDEIANA